MSHISPSSDIVSLDSLDALLELVQLGNQVILEAGAKYMRELS